MAKTKHKSKPATKTAHKTFHKHTAEEPVTPSPEPASQTTQPANETIIPPVIQPEPEAEEAPASHQLQQTAENTIPVASEIAPQTEDITPNVVNDTPTTTDTKSTTVDTNNSTLTPAPEKPQNVEPLSSSPINDQGESKSKKPIIIVAIIVIILIALASSYFLYTKKLKTTGQKPQPTPIAQTSNSTPEPSPQTLNKADWTLEILNGSTKKGAAAALADKLTAKGYQVIITANAQEDVATSQVFFADSTKDQADLFLEDIKDELPNSTNAGNLQDSTASARIIIGEE